MKKRAGILFEAEIVGEAKELPDIGYPIPDMQRNQYELNVLFTRSVREDRATRKENDNN